MPVNLCKKILKYGIITPYTKINEIFIKKLKNRMFWKIWINGI